MTAGSALAPVPAEAATSDRYGEVLRALYSRELFGIKLGLRTTRRLLAELGNPERRFPAILVAGTNGKGSTAVSISAILREAGYRVGLFTSPHLHEYRERFRIDGRAIRPEDLVDLAEPMLPIIHRLGATYFEAAAGIAFAHFAEAGVDVAVVEVGLGGRLDATNVLPRPLSVVTDVDIDHRERLGRTLGAIAAEKAGIMRWRGRVISGCRRPAAIRVIRDEAARRQARLIELDRAMTWTTRSHPAGNDLRFEPENGWRGPIQLPLLGEHQARNAALAVLTVREWARSRGEIDDETVARGLGRVRWPGRMEIVNRAPLTIVDAGHNPQGAEAAAAAVAASFPGRKPVLVFGCLAAKEHRKMLSRLLKTSRRVVLAPIDTHRSSAPLDRLARDVRRLDRTPILASSIGDALETAGRLAGADGLVLATGSSYLAAEVRKEHGLGVVECL